MRAHLFQGNDYYPNGFFDYVKSFDDADEAVQYAIDNPHRDWYSVLVDNEDRLVEYDGGYYQGE